MPNCEECAFSKRPQGTCDLFGVETSLYLLCHAFAAPGQSQEQARAQWPILRRLRPGVIYEVEPSVEDMNPRAVYRMMRTRR